MSAVTLKSTFITNRDASPAVKTDAYISGGTVKEAEGYVTTGAADIAGSIYKMCQVPSNARLSQIILNNEALGTGCTLDVGAYYPTYIPQGGGSSLAASVADTAISNAFFCSGQAAASANTELDVTNQSGSYTIDKQEECLWQALGLASDPEIPLDIVVHVNVAVAQSGKVGLKVKYVV